ncbi:hypothetical protein PG996_011430 [Apiospora saccharicola]|uniref:Uncharacterized protein n=1 Tax=Apiospora saccharicola TaxID=335842 RepID=A0ABR1UF15_9PEZI
MRITTLFPIAAQAWAAPSIPSAIAAAAADTQNQNQTASASEADVMVAERGLPPVFAHGRCGLHFHIYDERWDFSSGEENEQLRKASGQPGYHIRVYDAHRAKKFDEQGKLEPQNGWPAKNTHMESLDFWATPDDTLNVVTFQYGGEKWESGAPGTKNDHCSVGRWDRKRGVRIQPTHRYTIDMDCGFPC